MFEVYLGELREDPEHPIESNDFVDAVQQVKLQFARMLTKDATFSDIRKFSDRCKGSPESELRTISECPGLISEEFDFETRFANIQSALQLVGLRQPLKMFLNCLHQYGFACAKGDEACRQLDQIVDSLHDEDAVGRMTVSDCGVLGSKLRVLLGDQSGAVEQHILLFGAMSRANEVWAFVREKEWSGTEGLRRFNDEYQNVTNQLQGEVYESAVLDQLDLAVRCVLDARATTICSLNLVH